MDWILTWKEPHLPNTESHGATGKSHEKTTGGLKKASTGCIKLPLKVNCSMLISKQENIATNVNIAYVK